MKKVSWCDGIRVCVNKFRVSLLFEKDWFTLFLHVTRHTDPEPMKHSDSVLLEKVLATGALMRSVNITGEGHISEQLKVRRLSSSGRQVVRMHTFRGNLKQHAPIYAAALSNCRADANTRKSRLQSSNSNCDPQTVAYMRESGLKWFESIWQFTSASIMMDKF